MTMMKRGNYSAAAISFLLLPAGCTCLSGDDRLPPCSAFASRSYNCSGHPSLHAATSGSNDGADDGSLTVMTSMGHLGFLDGSVTDHAACLGECVNCLGDDVRSGLLGARRPAVGGAEELFRCDCGVLVGGEGGNRPLCVDPGYDSGVELATSGSATRSCGAFLVASALVLACLTL